MQRTKTSPLRANLQGLEAGARNVTRATATCQQSGGKGMASLTVKPTYLPDAENNREPSVYRDLIRKAQEAGANTDRSGTFSLSGLKPPCILRALPKG
jgi:hypothetical protein